MRVRSLRSAFGEIAFIQKTQSQILYLIQKHQHLNYCKFCLSGYQVFFIFISLERVRSLRSAFGETAFIRKTQSQTFYSHQKTSIWKLFSILFVWISKFFCPVRVTTSSWRWFGKIMYILNTQSNVFSRNIDIKIIVKCLSDD